MWKAFSALKIKGELKPRADNLVFRLHYRYTCVLFLACATLTTLYDFVGNKIDCMMTHDDGGLKKVVDSYCYITGTYTVDKLQDAEVGVDVPAQGVGPHKEADEVTYHSWYQWVPFVLVLQGGLFYLPHLIWKRCERGMFRAIIQDLSVRDYLGEGKKGVKLGNYFSRHEQFEALSVYLTDYAPSHKGWAIKFISCEFLNLAITISTVLLTNYFLGGEFFEYGINVFAMTGLDPENRTDPMAQVFPTMAKCTFNLFGPSGTIENRDVMCLLPTNIANEKIYIVLWFWLFILAIIGCIWMTLRLVSILKPIRNTVFMIRFYDSPRRSLDDNSPLSRMLANKEEIQFILNNSNYSDYLLLTQLADNMETAMFSEFVKYLARYRMKHWKNTSDEELDAGLRKKAESLDDVDYPQGNAYPMMPRPQDNAN